MIFFRKKEKAEKVSARDLDKAREAEEQKKRKKKKEKPKRSVKKTVIDTMPYERFVSNHVMLMRTGVRLGRQILNLYSKSYLVPDINYSALTKEEQEEIQQVFTEMLNGFDNSVSLQISLVNSQINKEEFTEKMMLKSMGDGLDAEREEFNGILRNQILNEQKGRQCRLYFTVTVASVDLDAANNKFFDMELLMNRCLSQIRTEAQPLTANHRVRLMADILYDVDQPIGELSRYDFAHQKEKQLCCPEYFEFKRDYFMFNDKYARCLYFRRIPPINMRDSLFNDLLDSNLSMILTTNIEFVEPADAIRMLRRKQTDMKQEAITKTKRSADAGKGVFVDPIEGTQLSLDMEETAQLLEKLQSENQKMTFCQWIIMVTADSYEELDKNTEMLRTILRTNQIESMNAPYRQEVAFSSVMPVGNSFSCDTENNLQVRRTMSTETTALFSPFNARELMHQGGLWYGQNSLSRSVIMFDRRLLDNPNGFIFGVPGSGKSFLAKLEMIFSILSTTDEILILDPEREYTALAELLGGEVIHISENSRTHINPLDLTENPDKTDTEYDPITAKLDFLLSFFSCILGNQVISPIQKTIIDSVMRETYKKNDHPTLKEYYAELERYEQTAADEVKSAVTYLRQTLHLYVHGSISVFSNQSNVDIQKRIVVYDIKDLGKNLQTLGMMIVMENLWDRVAKNRARGIGTRIYIDEMYLLFKSEQSANFFYELYKRARKWGGIPTGITQNVDDLLRSALARTMLSNTQFVVMLSQNTTDRDQLSDLLKISPETMRFVTNPPSGSGLIYAGKFGTIPFDARFPSNTRLYKIISTRFGENHASSQG